MNNTHEDIVAKLEWFSPPEQTREILDSSNLSVGEAADKCIKKSEDLLYLKNENGTLLLVSGVAPVSLLGRIAVPWFLSTKFSERYPRYLLKHTKPMINKWLDRWPILSNYIDSRYEQTVRWAKWAGFTFYGPEPVGANSAPFYRIEIRRE